MARGEPGIGGDIDVLVIGAGIIGVASAYHILRNNPAKKVLVVDRYSAPGQGNTGRSNAMFRNTFSSRDNQTLSDCSIDFYLHVQEELRQDIGLQQIGYLWLMNEVQLSASGPFLEGMASNGIEIRRYAQPDLASLIPELVSRPERRHDLLPLDLPKVDAGIFGPKCGRLDPDKLTRLYAKLFVELGGRFAFNTQVESLGVGPERRLGLDREPFVWQEARVDGVQVTGQLTGVLRPKTVVLACGAWGNGLLSPIGIDGHVRVKKRQLFSIATQGSEALGRLVRTKGFNGLDLIPMMILPKCGVHFKPVAEEGAIWVACEDEINRPFLDQPETDLDNYKAELEFYEKSVKPVLTGYFPAFGPARIKAMWAGLYSYNTVDYLPFVFRENNLIVVGGDSGSGIMKGDALGRIVDAVYREEEEAVLFGDRPYKTSRLSFDRRNVEREEWVI